MADNNLRERLQTTQLELQRMKALYSEMCEENKKLMKHLEFWQAMKYKHIHNEECWIYQGDGSDHLESLAVPVVIDAEKLIELGA